MGDLTVENKATLEHDCILNGNLTTSIVVVDEGATFKGLCKADFFKVTRHCCFIGCLIKKGCNLE